MDQEVNIKEILRQLSTLKIEVNTIFLDQASRNTKKNSRNYSDRSYDKSFKKKTQNIIRCTKTLTANGGQYTRT